MNSTSMRLWEIGKCEYKQLYIDLTLLVKYIHRIHSNTYFVGGFAQQQQPLHQEHEHVSTTLVPWRINPHICSAGDWEEINLLLLLPRFLTRMFKWMHFIPIVYEFTNVLNNINSMMHDSARAEKQLSIIGNWDDCFHVIICLTRVMATLKSL